MLFAGPIPFFFHIYIICKETIKRISKHSCIFFLISEIDNNIHALFPGCMEKQETETDMERGNGHGKRKTTFTNSYLQTRRESYAVPATPLRKGEGKFITLALWRLLSLSVCCVNSATLTHVASHMYLKYKKKYAESI